MMGQLISAGGTLLSGIIGSSSAKKQTKMQIEAQREFAQNGVQWKVADAKKAGIHPLAALGAQTHSFSPVSSSDPLPEAMASASQQIGGAITKSQNKADQAYIQKSQALSLQRGELENALLASQIATYNQPARQAMHIPAVGQKSIIDGQADVPSGVNMVDLDVTKSGHAKHIDPAPINDVGHIRTSTGGFAPVMSTDAKERLEEDLVGEVMWSLRNRLLPFLARGAHSPPYPAPAGHRWSFDGGEYRLKKRSAAAINGGGGW